MNQFQIFATSPAFVPVSTGWSLPLSLELHRLGMTGAAWQAEALEARVAELTDDIERDEYNLKQAVDAAWEDGRRDRDAEIAALETEITKLQDALQALDDANVAANATIEALRATQEVESIDYSAVPLPVDLDFTQPGAIPEPLAADPVAADAVAPAEPVAQPAAVPAGAEPLPLPWFSERPKGWTIAAIRCHQVGTDAILVQSDDSCGYQLFMCPNTGYLAAYVGLGKKPFSCAKYRADAQETWTASIAQAIAKERTRRANARKVTAERAAEGHKLAVGDVLRASWGYDQTNIDYYEVTRKIGRTMIEVRKIGGRSEDTAWLQGDCAPQPGAYIGEPQRCRPSGDSVRIDSVRYATKLTPKAVIAGKPIYGVDSWTAYH